MARGSTGRWVARAAATGGGRTYRGQAPVRWYSSLVLIVLLGVTLVVYSRYENSHPAAATQPAIGSHWYAAVGFDICGKVEPALASNPSTATVPGISTQGDGVIHISPTSSVDAGNHATLARFVQSYPGLELTQTKLKVPSHGSYTNGQKCPSSTPDAHKSADVQIQTWASPQGPAASQPQTVSDPASLKLANGQLITVAFVPPGSHIPKPSESAISTMLSLISQGATTTTTAPITPGTGRLSTPW